MAKGFNIRAWLGLDTKDYEKGMSRARRQTRQFTKGLKTSMKGAASSSTGFLDKMTGGAVSGFSEMFKGVKLATKGMGGFKTALIGTGIGALVVALGSLVAYFTQTKAGADLVSKGMTAFGAVMDAIKARITTIGGAIVKLFKGDFKGAVADAKGAFEGLGEAIVDNYNKSAALSAREVQLKKDQIEFIKKEKQAELERSDLLLKSRDKEKYSAKQRNEFERQAGEVIKRIGAEKLRLLDEEIALLKERQNQGDNTYEDDKALAELEAQRLGSQKDINNQLREIQNRITTTNSEQAKLNEGVQKEVELRRQMLKEAKELSQEIQNQWDSMEFPELDGEDIASPLVDMQEELKRLQEIQSLALSTEDYLRLGEQIDIQKNKIAAFKGEISGAAGATDSIGIAAKSMAGAFNQAGAGVAANIARMGAGIGDLIQNLIKQGLAAQLALPWPKNLIAVSTTLASAISTFSSLPKFQDGGILGGNSYSGDKLLFRGNSGEMILNKSQQASLFKQINKGGSLGSGTIMLKAKGEDLVGAIGNNQVKKRRF